MIDEKIIEYINSLTKTDKIRLLLFMEEQCKQIKETTPSYPALLWNAKNPEHKKELNKISQRKHYARQKTENIPSTTPECIN